MSAPARRPIARLAPATVARIAAGEVVEGPASVVKELVENAYDAGAREVRVELEGGGIERIRVSDDGSGILPAELPLSVERHATSKLDASGELSRIATMGFRGEALASIASVSRLSIRSRPTGADSASAIDVEGGALGPIRTEGGPPGTSVEVRSLFFNTPARRKFLRSAAAEQVEVARLVGALYLARPDVGLTLGSEGGELARYPPSAVLADAVVRVFGPELLGRTVEVRAAAERGSGIDAVLSTPSVTRGSSASIHLSVNGRVVASRALTAAVRLAYEDYLPRSRFPIGAVHLSLDPSRVDVNVHPTKREVRIAREREVADGLRRSVREALRSATSSRELPTPPERRRLDPPAPAGPIAPPEVEVPIARLPEVEPPARAPGRQRRLETAAPRAVGPAGARPGLTLLGPVFRLYWVAESDGALLLIDQHAASERVVYEALRREGHLARQELVEPPALPLTARQVAALSAHREAVDASGFTVAPFGGSTYRVEAVPAYRGRRASALELPALLDELADGGRPAVPDGLVERRAASIACHAAIRGGEAVSSEEMGRTLDALYRLEGPNYACPHGRPILVRLDRGRLDRWFLRSSP